MKNEKNFWQRIKNFFATLFSKTKLLDEGNEEISNDQNNNTIENTRYEENSNKNNFFVKYEEDKKIIDLQKLFLSGKISEKDLTQEQIISLEKLFDSQIDASRRKNSAMKKKILKSLLNNENVMELLKKFQRGEITEKEMTKEQLDQISFLYDMEIEKVKNDITNLKAKIA